MQNFWVSWYCPEDRFVTQKPADWSPFSDRFPRADWMQW